MTITQLRYFNAVYRLKNVTNAARELYVSQPSVSNSIRELEDELGVQLFFRIKKRLTPTREGEFFFQESERLLQDIDRLTQQMQNMGSKRNLIRIGIPPMIGTLLFPQIFSIFQKANPDIRIEIVEYGSMTCREKVMDETLDLAIIITNGVESNRLDSLHLLDTELQLCVGKKNPLAKRESITVEDIQDLPLILLPEGSYNRKQVFDLYKRSGYEPNILLHSAQLYTIEQFICFSDAGAFLFREFAQYSSNIVGISVSPPMEEVHVGLVWKKDKRLYADVIYFMNFIEDLNEKYYSFML